MLDEWQVLPQRWFGESVCRVWGGNGAMQRCVLKGEDDELMVDVVEVRVIPQHFEHGRRLPAHGTLTIDVRSGHAWRALEELARTKSAVVLQRPDGGALEMRLGELAKSRNVRVASGSQTSCTVTYCWRSP